MQNSAAAEAYKRQQVLTLMLYNGCLKFMKEGIEAIEKKDYEAANTNLQKAERIITEFRVTLNMDYEISHQLMPLYNYAYDCLVEGNMKSSVDKVNEAKDIISGLRDAWAQAMKKARADKGPGVREGRA